MGSRKDLIKRSLGITEYPWSSDDELEAATTAVDETSLHRTPAEPRPIATDNPGPSGLPTPISQQHEQQQLHQMQQLDQQQQASSRRNQARQDRDLFWSIIDSPYRFSSQNLRPRASAMSIPRVSHVPAAGATGDSTRRTARTAADIQSIMEFKRLHRNMRQRAYIASVIPVTRVNPGVIVPSEANSSIILPRHMPPRGRSRPTASASSQSINNVTSPRTVSWSEQPRPPPRAAAAPASPAPPAPLRAPPVHVLSEEDEVNNNPVPSLPPDVMSSSFGRGILSAIPEAPEAMDEPEVVDLDSNANVTLEEEIVAIDLETDVSPQNTSSEEATRAGTSAPVGAPDETDGRFTTEDMGGATGGSGDAVPEQSNHGVKRKRRDSDENLEPGSVKEFNQSLLRLLECPVCLEWMEPPMSQCRRGHLVCGRCRERLSSCPVCRTTFSSVRNRAMEGVAELLRYPCRHGCGREVRLRRRAPHEASCAARNYHCPLCTEAAPLPRAALARHFQGQHLTMMKIGRRHKFSVKVNVQQHDNWLIFTMEEYFHLKIDVDIHTWGVVVYVSYIGPKCDAKNYTYEVTIDGQHNQRKLIYARTTHSDLESSSLNVRRQDCFHLTLDQALNFIRFKNRHCDSEKLLDFNLEIAKVEQPASQLEESDS